MAAEDLAEISREEEDGFSLFVRITPKATRNAIMGVNAQADGKYCLNIHIAAIPENGKSNKELQKFLAKQLKLPASDIELTRGHTSRFKQLRLRGDKETLRPRLAALCS